VANNKEKNAIEDLDFEIQFLEGVLRNSPHFIEALINLGELYTKRGLYLKGLEVDLKLSQLRPDDSTVFYNLACSYSLVDDLEKAFASIKAAIEKGYGDFQHLEQDDDLSKLRQFPPFEDFFAQLKPRQRKKRT
jgi:tetratricopeptide (TPR) repeat protein